MYKTNRNILENLCIMWIEYARKSVYNKDKIRHRNTKQQEENKMTMATAYLRNMIESAYDPDFISDMDDMIDADNLVKKS